MSHVASFSHGIEKGYLALVRMSAYIHARRVTG